MYCFPAAFAEDMPGAESSLNSAHGTIIECYRAAVAAEAAGANVTELLDRLNEAGRVYFKAALAYKNGDYGVAAELADESRAMLENFIDEADVLRVEAEERGRWDFWVNFVGSALGSVLVIVAAIGIWKLLKRKSVIAGRRVRVEDYQAVFLVVTFALALLVASPALSRVLVYPRTEFFTEVWILDSNHKAENYPFNITRNQNYTIYLGIGNRLGRCSYYLVEVKFKNESQPSPMSFGPIEDRLPSPLRPLYSLAAFVGDEEVLEMPLTFSFDYAYNESSSRIEFRSLRLNDVRLDLSGCVAGWNSTRRGCLGFLFFEIWLYDDVESQFEYHGRFVGLWLNMTFAGAVL